MQYSTIQYSTVQYSVVNRVPVQYQDLSNNNNNNNNSSERGGYTTPHQVVAVMNMFKGLQFNLNLVYCRCTSARERPWWSPTPQ